MNGYKWLKNQLVSLWNLGANIRVIGRSVLGRKIYAIEIGEGPVVLMQYGIHAREYVACSLAVLHARLLLKQPSNLKFVLIPMANPDGTELALFGDAKLGRKNNLCLWKANARGVDLNNNFDAGFFRNNLVLTPSSHGYKGPHPESEPETKALVGACERYHPFLTISFHTKGEEVYFDFFQSHRNGLRDKKIAKLFAQDFGYKIKSTQKTSSGGFKDWCVSSLEIPSLTIELGPDELTHPIGCSFASNLLMKTKNIKALCEKAYLIVNRFNKGAT